MKLRKVVTVAVITTVAFVAGLYVSRPVKIAVTDVDISTKLNNNEELSNQSECKHLL